MTQKAMEVTAPRVEEDVGKSGHTIATTTKGNHSAEGGDEVAPPRDRSHPFEE